METITIKELSKKIKLGETNLRTSLCRLEKYVAKGRPLKYMLNKSFLLELKRFFITKMYDRNTRYFSKYHKVIKNINQLIEEIDGRS